MSEIRLLDIKKDINLIKNHFYSLDKESLRQRFNFAVSDYFLENYFAKLNDNDIYVGVIVKEKEENFLAGFLHIGINKIGEIGISVNKKYQGNKFATAMMVMSLFELQQKIYNENLEIDDVVMYCDSQNKASIGLGKKFGLHVIIESSNNTFEIAQTKQFKHSQTV